ncbi:MAG: site-2 protease family protein [Acidobacteriota bacterium]|nr:site-2 protease family protein [Acidobacteriota bacterium]
MICPQCRLLVHGDEVEFLRHSALSREEQEDRSGAEQLWQQALSLVPPGSPHEVWIRRHIAELKQAPATGAAKPAAQSKWTKRLGPLAPLALVLAKAKTLFFALFKLKFLFSFVAFFGFYWALFGAWFGIGFAVMILLHEMGHYVEVRRRGLPAEMPVFLPGLGAYVKWQALGVTEEVRAMISLAGPAAGTVAALVAYGLFLYNGHPLWAALAHTGAWLNLLNLIPVWVLDGEGAARPLDRLGCFSLLLFCGVLFWWTSQPVLLLVMAGLGWQIYKKHLPLEGSLRVQLYFASVLAVLGWLMHATPIVQ